MFVINQLKDYIVALFYKLGNYSDRIVFSIIILIVGIYLIRIFKKILKKALLQKELDPTLSKFIADMVIWFLRISLFITVISKLGIQTTSFVAVMGTIGLTVGLSLQGSLSNFAGGVLIIVFEPFRVGDNIEAMGVNGTVDSIQLFVTKIIKSNNVAVYIPNGALSNGTITNYSRNNIRRSELLITVNYNADIEKVKSIIFNVLKSNPKVLPEPAPTIEITSIVENVVKLSVHPWVNNSDFSEVNSEILENCKAKLHQAGIS